MVFHLNTANNAGVFNVGFTTTVPALSVPANLSRLRFVLTDESATDGDAVPPTSFTGTFSMDLLDPSGADNRLRPNELSGTDLLNAVFTGSAAINLESGKRSGRFGFSFRGSGSEFLLGLQLGTGRARRHQYVIWDCTTGRLPQGHGGCGTFFSKFARPILLKVREITEPLQPLVKAVKEPIPLLEELHAINENVPQSLLKWR